MRDSVKARAGNRHKRDPALVCQERLERIAAIDPDKLKANPDGGHLVATNPGMRALMDMRTARAKRG